MLDKELSIREILESQGYRMQKEIIQREINRNLLFVDRRMFKKDHKEKDLLKTMKLNCQNCDHRPKTIGKFEF